MPPAKIYLGLDLGGNHVKAALGDGDGAALLWQAEFPTHAEGGQEAVFKALALATEAGLQECKRQQLATPKVGLGTPGIIDQQTGEILYEIANLSGMKGANFRRFFNDQYQLSVRVENDANVAALAESRYGAAQGEDSMLMVTVGTGIGGGAVFANRLFTGHFGAAMELGHLPMVYELGLGRMCGCGKQGCLEAYAGGRAMLASWSELRQQKQQCVESLRLRDLIVADAADDALARQVLQQSASYLGMALAGVLHLLNPKIVVIGGGVVAGCSWYAAAVEQVLWERALEKSLVGVRFSKAQFGNQAGVIGAIALAQSDDHNPS